MACGTALGCTYLEKLQVSDMVYTIKDNPVWENTIGYFTLISLNKYPTKKPYLISFEMKYLNDFYSC